MVIAELGAVAFVEDEDDAFIFQLFELRLIGGLAVSGPLLIPLAVLIECQPQLLDGGDDHLVGVVVRQQAAHQGSGVGVFLHTAFLETVELLAGLAVEVLTIHHKHALVNVRVLLEQGGGLEGGERLAAAGGMPDEAVAVVFIDAAHQVLHGIHLVWPHHHQLLLACEENHVAAERAPQIALRQELLGEVVEMGDLLVVLTRKFINRQETLFSIEGEVAGVVVGKVVSAIAIAHGEQLHEAQQRARVAVAGIILVLDNLLHGPPWIDAEAL